MTANEKSRKETATLTRMMAKGRTHFVLIRGVFFWGLGTAALWSISLGFLQGWSWTRLLVALVLFPVGGLLWGSIMWWWLNRRLAKLASL